MHRMTSPRHPERVDNLECFTNNVLIARALPL